MQKNSAGIRQKLKSFLNTSYEYKKTFLFFLFLLTAINWFLIVMAEQIGPPDFYKLYWVSQRLFSGDFKVGIVPPLFPLLLYPLGKAISLFIEPTEAFIIAGRIIALAAAFGVTWFTYKILEKITGQTGLLAVAFMTVSPWFIKLVSFPITDMLYLFFAVGAFYYFSPSPGAASGARKSFVMVVAGVLTRFEGLLLILAGFVNYFKGKKRVFYFLAGLFPLVLGLFYFLVPRLFAHFTDIILKRKSYLYLFQHPVDFFNVIYSNIFFFIPHWYPSYIKMFLSIGLLAVFVYGVYRVYKIDRYWSFSLILYEVLFFIAKGYIDTMDPEREFRRIFSGLWMFYLLSIIGLVFLLKKIRTGKLIRSSAVLIFLACCVLVYPSSFHRSKMYVVSHARKAGYAAAHWIDVGMVKKNAVILCYTDRNMIEYYLQKGSGKAKSIRFLDFTVPMPNTPEYRERFARYFFQEVRSRGADYIIFDHYVVQEPEFRGINDVHHLLYPEQDNPRYFLWKKELFYKGVNVAYVLSPANVETDR